jgi:hypothetical protein
MCKLIKWLVGSGWLKVVEMKACRGWVHIWTDKTNLLSSLIIFILVVSSEY